jgi:peptidoglycan/LPS O-acetylase OafA/YrhL
MELTQAFLYIIEMITTKGVSMFKEIQYLRGAAVIMVIWGHMEFYRESTLDPYFQHMLRSGVDIFFVISGFVVGKNLFEMLELGHKTIIGSIENNIPNLKAFYIRRIFRLLPVAVLLIVFNTIMLLITGMHGRNEEIFGLFSHLTMQSDFDTINFAVTQKVRSMNHYWSLAVEERFYIFAPMLILCCRTPMQFMKLAVAIIVILPFIKVFGGYIKDILYLNGFLRFDAFMIGMMIYLIGQHTEIWKKTFPRQLNRVATNMVVLLILVLIARMPVMQTVDHKIAVEFIGSAYYYHCVYFFTAILIVLAIQDKGYVLSIPGFQKILGWMGDRSYCIYVFQFFYEWVTRAGIKSIFKIEPNKIELGVGYIVVMFVFTETIYRLYETPLRNRGKRIAKRIMEEKGAISAI